MTSSLFKSFGTVFLFLLSTFRFHATSPSLLPQQGQLLSPEGSIYLKVIGAINRNEFRLADSVINQQLAQGKDSLQWLFFRGMRYYSDLLGMNSFVNKSSLAQLSSSFSQTIHIADTRLELNPKDSLALFFGGGAYGYYGFSYIADGSLFKAVSSAKKGARYHEKLISLHPECYDAYLGPGLINLAASAAPWILKPILFLLGISGTEEKAQEYLSAAYEKGTWVRVEAGIYLAQLYERQKQFSKSSEIYLALTPAYPMRIALRAQALSGLSSEKRYNEIISLSKDAMASFEARRFHFTSNDSSRVVSLFSACSGAYKQIGDTAAAIRIWQDYLNRDAYKGLSKWWGHSSLAELHLLRRDTTNALRSLEQVVAGDPPEKYKDKARARINELTKQLN
jgi:hypothetical protein